MKWVCGADDEAYGRAKRDAQTSMTDSGNDRPKRARGREHTEYCAILLSNDACCSSPSMTGAAFRSLRSARLESKNPSRNETGNKAQLQK
jgi:hypothetical protein